MNKCLVIAACLGFLLLSGCNRCGQWDWYEPCDLIEGRAVRSCGPRAQPCYQPGQVVRSEVVVNAADCAPAQAAPPPAATIIVVEETVIEEAIIEEAVVE